MPDLRLPGDSFLAPAGGTLTLTGTLPEGVSDVSIWIGGTVTDVDNLTGATEYPGVPDGPDTVWTIPVPVARTRTAMRWTIGATVARLDILHPSQLGTDQVDETITLALAEYDITITLLGGAGGGGVHNDLSGRDAADAHPQAAVTGLTAALASKATLQSNTFTGTQITRRPLSQDPSAPTTIEEYQDGAERPVFRVEGVELPLGVDPLPLVTLSTVEYDIDGQVTGFTAKLGYGPTDDGFGYNAVKSDDESIEDVPVRVGFPVSGDPRDAVPRATFDTHAARHGNGGDDEITIDASQIGTGTIDAARLPAVAASNNSTITKTVGDVYGAPSGTTSGTNSLTSATTAFFVWTPPWNGFIDRLYVEVTTGGTGGSTGRLGVWAVDTATNLPTGTPLDVCPSTVAIDAVTTVSSALTTPMAITKGVPLAFALQASANTTFRALSNYRAAGSTTSSILGNSCVRQGLSYATGMAGQTAAAAGDTSNLSIVIEARVSA